MIPAAPNPVMRASFQGHNCGEDLADELSEHLHRLTINDAGEGQLDGYDDAGGAFLISRQHDPLVVRFSRNGVRSASAE
jgi:hypothetical protein